ncbi:oligopeptide ABC transporter ATP-binding protein OppD [Mesoplasma lactucae]|uniref:ABC transporter ATP-binding protein n=1 Tax=Mesoplasma lactucae ATCC 49193 TaxID=81460 RepID=A0A291IR28_9MOLU|nr:oligopeptide ABC transporter ATP-binding protein OppD [Mesoplasma lactucae]ATG97249.1 ABC transporter ATP-binding protein [Mesoplasma lactucae ATCC 49193]ATZ20305.1 oligopeptide ABC transporter ATP-binding protein [Mesoplasma lactucae ATCC 49193]MCL8216476.1 Vitamin B12 import ATP-binding protein BtuD [Mesoplasma lactucae ATCC 49193]
MAQQRTILSINDLVVKFRVRSKTLTAIRNISFDIYDGETVAIVGESGSGKSVLTKTLTNMIDSNGYIAKGSIDYFPSDLTKVDPFADIKTDVDLVQYHRNALETSTKDIVRRSNKKTIRELKKQIKTIDDNNPKKLENKINRLEEKLSKNDDDGNFSGNNRKLVKEAELKQKLASEKHLYSLSNDEKAREHEIKEINRKIKDLKQENYNFSRISAAKKRFIHNGIWNLISYKEMTDEDKKDKYMYKVLKPYYKKLEKLTLLKTIEFHLRDTYSHVVHEKDYEITNDEIEFLQETWKLEKRNYFSKKHNAERDLRDLRGGTIATIFQDPMTSLNPLLTVGYQLIEAIREHQDISHKAAKDEAIDLLRKVGITNPEKRMKDIPGRYSGGMRQRVVIAIALACKPKILICDEPTTALDVTIQAQILKLIKDLKKEYGFTVIFITHDLGVVANIADRVAVVYAGQIIEFGTTAEIFEDPKHPYTWALLSSLPQLGKEGEKLFAIDGTPPSLFNKIQGDAFAPRNKYALDIDYLYEPPLFKVTDTHFAKTWLLDPRAPKVEKPVELSRLKQAIEEQKVGD